MRRRNAKKGNKYFDANVDIILMKILHIYDTAGSSSIIAKYQRMLGHEVKVITIKRLDAFGISAHYDSVLFDGSALAFYWHCLKLARNYDVIHVHSLSRIIPYLRLRYPRKKIIIQFHGTDLRKPDAFKRDIAMNMADVIFITTKDLFSFLTPQQVRKAHYTPNVADVEMFSSMKKKPVKDAWLSLFHSGVWENTIDGEMLRQQGIINIENVDRTRSSVKYWEMPELLSQYKGYIDIKVVNGKRLMALSKTALEALACGLAVFTFDNSIMREYPAEHNPYDVARKMCELYLDPKKTREQVNGV